MYAITKVANLNWIVQGGQAYLAFPFSKGSVAKAVKAYQDQTL